MHCLVTGGAGFVGSRFEQVASLYEPFATSCCNKSTRSIE